MDIERSTIQNRRQYWEDNVKLKQNDEHQIEKTRSNSDSEDEKVPEIRDIYDQIYGIVKSKRVFYESKKGVVVQDQNSKSVTLISENIEDKNILDDNNQISLIDSEKDVNTVVELDLKNVKMQEKMKQPNSPTCSIAEDISIFTTNKDMEFDQISETSSTASLPLISVAVTEGKLTNPDLLKSCEVSCTKCHKLDFINDRSEVLAEINTNLKLELESTKKDLKEEMVKNNELNFEIANIESVLETYYKEAKNQKSTLASIYSTMKDYVSENKSEFQESYTYKRIKMIADYMDSLKNKLEHQDKIIKNNFIENPYYTDLIIKHEAILKQLDELSKENEELKDNIKKKSSEELETIKELNRQKFQLENKCKEVENQYKNEIAAKEVAIKRIEDEHRKELEDFQTVLDRKDEDMEKIKKTTEARINNYKQELVIVYRKWKERKAL